MQNKINFFWFRRDLRLQDNNGLYNALKSSLPVKCIFIFDQNILEKLNNPKDQRVSFIYDQLNLLNEKLNKVGAKLHVYYGKPHEIWKILVKEYEISEVFTNHDYEPYAIKRDREISELLSKNKIKFNTFKDQVIFENNEVCKDDGKPYLVFTAYKNKWMSKLKPADYEEIPSQKYLKNLYQEKPSEIIKLETFGFQYSKYNIPSVKMEQSFLNNYKNTRNLLYIEGTSRVSVHLRFGTVSIRKCVRQSIKEEPTFLTELIWREFYMMILSQFPHVETKAFKPEYDEIQWQNDKKHFKAWCEGNTGYPIVDAGMRELNQTGFMHNRARMIVASFLTKHLLIDWRWGEKYFASHLMDFELASNNGGWQWCAGSGCDAAPYFRIFNPSEQTKKFDPNHEYIQKWVPEYKSSTYPKPIIEHALARTRCLKAYKVALG